MRPANNLERLKDSSRKFIRSKSIATNGGLQPDRINNPNETEPKKLYVKSFGCQMNVYDGQRLAEVMAQQGYETADSPDQADLMVLNTCHIRDKAAEKVYSEVGRLRALKKTR